MGIPPTQPWDLRLGAVQGHSNEVVDPYTLHHPLTIEEAIVLVGFSMLQVQKTDKTLKDKDC